jgi:hypothetical protein
MAAEELPRIIDFEGGDVPVPAQIRVQGFLG